MPRHILITGASSGIGAALARRYARPGMRLSLTARNAARLEQVATECRAAGAETDSQTLDVGDADVLRAWIDGCDSRQPVDMVIANAGLGGERVIAGPTGETLAVAREIVETNILGVINTVIPLLSPFAARKKGHVVLMSSLAAYVALPDSPVYCASKSAIRMYGDGLRRRLAKCGIRVTVVCPGFVDTPMSASLPGPRPLLWTAERAARHIVCRLSRGQPEIAFPWILAVIARCAGALPTALTNSILERARGSRR